MDMRHCNTVLFAGVLVFATALRAQEGQPSASNADRVVLQAGALPADFRLDGRLDPAEWSAATDSIATLVMVEPDEGEAATAPTVVKVLADRKSIVVGVRCFDSPANIVSFSKARDSDLTEEDHVTLVFDTFLDARSGFVFQVNPSGARYDALVSGSGEGVNVQWDALWEAETARDDSGWSVEVRIPIRSLTYPKGGTRWGFNVERRVQRAQETDRWSSPTLDHAIHQVSRAGLLAGLPPFDLGLGLSIRPALVGRMRSTAYTNAGGYKTEYDLEPSLDMAQKLGPNVNSALTVNTDFAETEVDVRQLNLTRFPVFFPEKRTFFLEGSDIFEFGLGLDEESLIPFHSRRIGLFGIDEEEQIPIPINAGGKLYGRLNQTNLGALVVNTRDDDELVEGTTLAVPQTTMGAARIAQNVFEESSVGLLGTFGDQQGRDDSWSAGLDFTYETSSFRGEKNLLFGTWGMLNDRAGLNGDKSAWGARIEYPNDLLDANLTSIHLGDGFDPSLGFVPRNNVHLWELAIEVNPRPGWMWMRQMFYEYSFRLFNKRDNSTWESYAMTIKPFDWLLESGDRFDFGVEPEGDRPPAIFEITNDVDLLPGSYEWVRWFVGARAAEKRRLSGELRYDFGTYYTGNLHTLEGRLTWKPSALFTLELTGEANAGDVLALIDDFEERKLLDLVEKKIDEELYGFRFLLNLSPDLQISSLTQYDTQSREIGTNNRLRWTFDPMGDIFIVYNHNLLQRKDKTWQFVSNELPIKVQYALRF